MTIDPDLLAICRRRRQERRCVACGQDTRRRTLCAVCIETTRYCPGCEQLWDRTELATKADRASEYCRSCRHAMDAQRRRAARMRPLAEYEQARIARVRDLAPRIARLVRGGQSYAQIAASLGLTRHQVSGAVKAARRLGIWPLPPRPHGASATPILTRPAVSLPPCVHWNAPTRNHRSWRITARITVRGRKVTISTRPATAANAALLGKMIDAARACRDAGGDAAAVKAAGLGVLK